MKIEMFDTLDAVLRGGSLAAAASETNLTASAVSMQMKQLETYLGQPLFDRSGHAIRPTRWRTRWPPRCARGCSTCSRCAGAA